MPILYRFLFLNQKAHHDQESAPMMNEQDHTHTSDDALEAVLDVARPLDAASARNCPQHTYRKVLQSAPWCNNHANDF